MFTVRWWWDAMYAAGATTFTRDGAGEGNEERVYSKPAQQRGDDELPVDSVLHGLAGLPGFL